jgi:hypothetical protein
VGGFFFVFKAEGWIYQARYIVAVTNESRKSRDDTQITIMIINDDMMLTTSLSSLLDDRALSSSSEVWIAMESMDSILV